MRALTNGFFVFWLYALLLISYSAHASLDDFVAATEAAGEIDMDFVDLKDDFVRLAQLNDSEGFKEKWNEQDGETQLRLAQADWAGTTLLMRVANSLFNPKEREEFESRVGNTEIVDLLCPLSNLESVDENGRTALRIALAPPRNVQIAKALIECGADVNKPDITGVSPFLDIVASGYWSLYELAVKKGARFDIQVSGRSLLYFAIKGYDRSFPEKEGVRNFDEEQNHQKIIADLRARGFSQLILSDRVVEFNAVEQVIPPGTSLFIFEHELSAGEIDPHSRYLEILDRVHENPSLVPDIEQYREKLKQSALDECFDEGFEESECLPPLDGRDPLRIEGPIKSYRYSDGLGSVLFLEYRVVYTVVVRQQGDNPPPPVAP
ncbi:MAG: hypothetical protein AAF203_04000 [Pseudomonadota bacterium]